MCNRPQINLAVKRVCAAEIWGTASTQVYNNSPDRKQYPIYSIQSELQRNIHYQTALLTLSATFANNSNTIFGTRLTCHSTKQSTFERAQTFEDPELRLQPNKSILVRSCGAAPVTVASFATKSFKVMGVSSFSRYLTTTIFIGFSP